jgi:hypothetical protein
MSFDFVPLSHELLWLWELANNNQTLQVAVLAVLQELQGALPTGSSRRSAGNLAVAEFANQPTENKYLKTVLARNQKTVWLDCHIPLHIAPVVPHLAVLGPRSCDESVFARLELVALHLIEESQHLVTFVTYVTNDNQLSARVATGQTMESHSLTNNWHTGHS